MPTNSAPKNQFGCVSDAHLADFAARADSANDYFELVRAADFSAAKHSRLLAIARGEPVSPVPGAAERLKVALFILGGMADRRSGTVQLERMPDVLARCQQMLSEVLLAHAVLMHPRCLTHVIDQNGKRGVAPVAHVVAMSPFGRFPMSTDVGVTSEALQAWASHPHVHAGLTTPAPKSDEVIWGAQVKRPMESCADVRSSREHVIISLEDLWRPADPREPNPYMCAVDTNNLDTWFTGARAVYANALASALGIYGTPNERFIELACEKQWLRDKSFRDAATRAILGGLLIRGRDLATGKLTFPHLGETPEEGLQSIIDKFVTGLCLSRADAASVFTAIPALRTFVATEPYEFMPFMRVLAQNGGPECLAELSALSDVDARGIEQWVAAARLCATEVVMTRVIDKVSANGDNVQHLSVPGAPMRRNRGV